MVVGDRRSAERLLELLEPFADRNAISLTQLPFGPVALRLGTLAALLERWDDAERHFEAALACCERVGAGAVRARVLLEYAGALRARSREGDAERAAALLDEARRLAGDLGLKGLVRRIAARAAESPVPPQPGPEARFVREGEFWTHRVRGQHVRMRDVKGLRHIAFLLASPGRGGARARAGGAADGAAGDARPPALAQDAVRPRPGLDPLLDQRAERSTGPGSRSCARTSRRPRRSPTTSGRRGSSEEIDALVASSPGPRGWAAATGRCRRRPSGRA